MSVKINGTEISEGIVGTNLTQSLGYTEGDTFLPLGKISFNNGVNYHERVYATFTINSGVANIIELKTTLDNFDNSRNNSPIIKVSDSVYQISSAYRGHNDYSSLSATLANLYLQLLVTDTSSDYNISVVIEDSSGNTATGSIIVEGTGTIDAININQTNTITEDRSVWRYATDGDGLPQVQDQLGAGSGRTYRVTYSPLTGGDEQYRIFSTESGPNGTDGIYSSTVSFEGNQNTVNSRMGSFHIDMGPDWNTSTHVVYTQEVTFDPVENNPVPYVQETGALIFDPIVPDIADTVALTQTYDEDKQKLVSPIATINDARGTQFTQLTYDCTIQMSNAIAGTINIGTFDNVDTYSINNLTKPDMQAQFDMFEFSPSVDYIDNFFFTITLSREQEQGSPTWSGRQTLIDNEVVQFNIGNIDADNGYTVNIGPYNWSQNSNTLLSNFATITDQRGYNYPNITYKAIVSLDAPADDTNGQLRSFGSGGSNVWDDINTLTIEGTVQEVQSHLGTIEWWSRGPLDSFTMVSSLERNIDGAGYVQLNSASGIQMNTGSVLPTPVNTDLTRLFDEDAKTSFADETKAVAPTASNVVYSNSSTHNASAGNPSGYGAGVISDIDDPSGNTKQYTVIFVHSGIPNVSSYDNINNGGVPSSVWDEPSQTWTISGTINQINDNIDCSNFGCPLITVDTAGTVTVNVQVNDNTLGDINASSGTYDVFAS